VAKLPSKDDSDDSEAEEEKKPAVEDLVSCHVNLFVSSFSNSHFYYSLF